MPEVSQAKKRTQYGDGTGPIGDEPEPESKGLIGWIGNLFKPKPTAETIAAEAEKARAAAAEAEAKARAAAVEAAEKARAAATAAVTTAREAEAKAESLGATTEQVYVVKSGDYLSKIAQQVYGSAARWPEIYEANKALIGDNPNLIRPGQTLRIP